MLCAHIHSHLYDLLRIFQAIALDVAPAATVAAVKLAIEVCDSEHCVAHTHAGEHWYDVVYTCIAYGLCSLLL